MVDTEFLKAIENLIDKKMEMINKTMEKRFDAIDKRFDAIDKRFDAIDKRFDTLQEDVSELKIRMEKVESDTIALRAGQITLKRDIREVKEIALMHGDRVPKIEI